MTKPIYISPPQIGREEIRAVTRVLVSGQLAHGRETELFEREFAKYIGSKYAAAVSNGTAALHLSLLSLGIGPGDEVITTPFTFAATTEAILWTGATPVFVDINPYTYNIDHTKIPQAITQKTRAILPVHLYGQPADLGSIIQIIKKSGKKIYLIEDCAQATGAEVSCQLSVVSCQKRLRHLGGDRLKRSGGRDSPDGGGIWKRVGSIGDIGCFSFYATKNMTTGEGGMITTDSGEIYDRVLLLRNHGSNVRYRHQILGGNFRMTEMQSALGVVQLRKLDKLNKIRQSHAAFLSSRLSSIKGLQIPRLSSDNRHVFHQYTVRVTDEFPVSRDKLLTHLTKEKIGACLYYPTPIHRQAFMKKYPHKGNAHLKEARKAAREVLSLPVHPGLTKRDLTRIVSAIKKFTS